MYRKAVESHEKSDISLLLERVIDLDRCWKLYEHNTDADFDSDAEASVLCGKWDDISYELSSFVCININEFKIKFECHNILNKMEDMTAEGRIDAADNAYDRVAWSIIRDLDNVHLIPA